MSIQPGDYDFQLYTEQFNQGIEMLPQHMDSKLEQYTRSEGLNLGEGKWFDFVSPLDEDELNVRTARFADTEFSGIQRSKRFLQGLPYPKAIPVDTIDQLRSLNDPLNSITMSMGAMNNRKKDKIIMAAAIGSALERTGNGSGNYTHSTVTFDTTNQVVGQDVGNTNSGLNIDKLLRARRILADNSVMGGRLILVASETDKETLLANATEVQSVDTSRVRALVDGEIDYYGGFNFVWLPTSYFTTGADVGATGDTVRYCFAFEEGTLYTGYNAPIQRRVSERSDKNYIVQAWTNMEFGATRMVDDALVRIDCFVS